VYIDFNVCVLYRFHQATMPRRNRKTKLNRGKNGMGGLMVPGATQIRYTPTRNGLPYPEIWETTFWTEADYKIPIATASLTNGQVKLNSMWLPFRPSGATAFPSYTFLGPATESTLFPTGLTSMMGGSTPIYETMQCIHSRIKLRWNGSNSGNNVMAVIVPAFNTASLTDVYKARTYPFAKQGSFNVSKPNTNVDKDGWMTHECNPYELFGFNKIQASADDAVQSTIASDPPYTLWWWIFLQSNDQDVSATTASTLQVRLEQRVRLSNYGTPPVTVNESVGSTESKISCGCCQHKRPP